VTEAEALTRFRQTARGRILPINRRGTSEDIGRAAATLAAADLPFMTGAAIVVDRGMQTYSY
jgi:NAD(P)-dependent dehydrogenase (short-subunit alcohol dehydrogenase family)